MAKAYGDELGILWQKEIYIGRSAAKNNNKLRGSKLPDPLDYRPPDYRSILDCKRIALDIETYDPNLEAKGPGVYRNDGYCIGIAIDYGDGDRRYYPLRHQIGCNLNESEFIRTLRDDAREFTGTLVNANLQYDLDWLGSLGVYFEKCKFFDVQYAEPLLDENLFEYSLESIAQRHLGIGKFTSTLETHYGDDFIKHLREIHPQYVGEYACGDVYLPLEIMDRQIALLEKDGLTELCQLENDLLPLLLQMRRVGVRIDVSAAEQAKSACDQEAEEIGRRMKELVGFEVEIYAAESIARAFEKLSIPYPRTAKTNAPSFRRNWLENHPSEIAKLVNKRRGLEKISGTFLRNYLINGHVNGRVHGLFHPLRSDKGGTVSGRFSSSNPNLQNIPARDSKLGPMCRAVFISDEDHDWGRIDWSQIEYRFLVHYAVATHCTGAEMAADMYRQDKNTNFHKFAGTITGKGYEAAKSINFGVAYGMGEETMAANLGTSVEEARPILAEFHRKLPFLKEIYGIASRQADKNGFIRTILNRKRRFELWEKWGKDKDKIYLPNARYQELEPIERRGYKRARIHVALNSLLQGSAADLMKKSMVNAYQAGLFKELIPHLTVHDELDVSVPKTKRGGEAFKELIHIMENSITLNVPVLADAKTGRNWSECK